MSEAPRIPANRMAAAAVCVMLAVAAAHGGALGHGFVTFDDDIYVTNNPQVKPGLTAEGAAWAVRIEPRKTYYHPLTWLSLMLDAEVFGVQRPWGFHLTNLLLHAATAALLLLILARATGRLGPSLAAALLFAVHPLTVEAVSWVTERKSVLSAALGLGAILAYVRYAERPGRVRLATVVALQAGSLLAKPTFVILPALLLLLDVWPLGRARLPAAISTNTLSPRAEARPLRVLLVEKLPFLLLSLVSSVLTVYSTSVADGSPKVVVPPLGLRLENAVASFSSYLGASFWPGSLSAFHPFPHHVPLAKVTAGFALVALLSSAALAAWRRVPATVVGWVWFLVALAPALGVKQSGLWPAWADRFAYVPLMGLAIAVAFAATDLTSLVRLPPLLRPILAAATIAALSVATRSQVAVWSDSFSLYRRAISVEPGSAEMHMNLAAATIDAGRLSDAEPMLKQVLAIEPEWRTAHVQLGALYMSQLRWTEAEHHLREAVRLDPRQVESLFNLAELLRLTGRADEARPLYARFALIAPERYAAQRTQARLYTSP